MNAPDKNVQAQAILQQGYDLARENGIEEPRAQDAIWELLVEMLDTLRRMPDRERAWLVRCERSGHPETMRSWAEEFAAAVAGGGWGEISLHLGPPSRAAITRLDVVLAWPGLVKSKQQRRDQQVLLALAAGAPVRVIRAKFGCSRRTIYDIRDRCLIKIALALGSKPKPKTEAG